MIFRLWSVNDCWFIMSNYLTIYSWLYEWIIKLDFVKRLRWASIRCDDVSSHGWWNKDQNCYRSLACLMCHAMEITNFLVHLHFWKNIFLTTWNLKFVVENYTIMSKYFIRGNSIQYMRGSRSIIIIYL